MDHNDEENSSILPVTVVAMLVAFAMAVAIGAQDVSNALGTSVGSKAITVKQAVYIGAICEFVGSLAGGSVAHTISHGIFDSSGVSAATFRGVMASTMAGAVVWLFVATWASLPVSTTHSLIGSLVGIALVYHGADSIKWSTIGKTVLSWVISPAMGCLVAFALFFSVRKLIFDDKHPAAAVQRWMPAYQGGTFGLLVAFLLLLGPEAYRMHPLVAAAVGIFAALVGSVLASAMASRRGQADEALDAAAPKSPSELEALVGDSSNSADTPTSVPGATPAALPEAKTASAKANAAGAAEKAFLPLMVLTACVVSFAHGSNDISNAVGPMLAILLSDKAASGAIGYSDGDGTPIAVLSLGGVGIVVGLAVWGYKVMETVGESITKLTFSRGYAAQVGTALTVLLASVSGISVSTTHCLIGAITGVALADGGGVRSINQATLRKIAASWVITIPAAAVAALMCHTVLLGLTGGASDSVPLPEAPAAVEPPAGGSDGAVHGLNL